MFAPIYTKTRGRVHLSLYGRRDVLLIPCKPCYP